MSIPEIHQCPCDVCRSGEDHPDKVVHHQINVFISRLNEQQQRWYAAMEAMRLGHGGIKKICEITGLSEPTVRKGREELNQDLANRPVDRIRLPGAGRPSVEKKHRK